VKQIGSNPNDLEPSNSGLNLVFQRKVMSFIMGMIKLFFHSAYLQRACGYTPESVTVTWMPYSGGDRQSRHAGAM
jgi:hypothetical protein